MVQILHLVLCHVAPYVTTVTHKGQNIEFFMATTAFLKNSEGEGEVRGIDTIAVSSVDVITMFTLNL